MSMDEDEIDYHSAVNDQIQDRMAKATREIAAKYANSTRQTVDTSVTGPTGAAYKAAAAEQMRHKNTTKSQPIYATISETKVSSLDEDFELRRLREERLKQLKIEKDEKLENIGKGHGQYRDIVQDEFLSEVTSSQWVICHFYHRDFERCKIYDHHLSILSTQHYETKFIKINAEKAPFFVDKLIIRTIPTLVLFQDGVAKDKIIGFDGLITGLEDGHENEWKTVTLATLLSDKGMLHKNNIQDSDIEKEKKAQEMEIMKQKILRGYMNNTQILDDDEDDFNLSDDEDDDEDDFNLSDDDDDKEDDDDDEDDFNLSDDDDDDDDDDEGK